MATDVLNFLQKDYELKVRYLSDHYSRMWTRFNFFLVATTAVTVAYCTKLNECKEGRPFLWAGALIAFCWFVFGAQDRYLVEAYRNEVKRVARYLFAATGIPAALPELADEWSRDYAAVGDVEHVEVDRRPYQWRVDLFSTTKLAAWFPLLVLVGWLLLIAVTWR